MDRNPLLSILHCNEGSPYPFIKEDATSGFTNSYHSALLGYRYDNVPAYPFPFLAVAAYSTSYSHPAIT